MSSWIADLGLGRFVDPHASNLAWCSYRDIESDGKACCTGGERITSEPAEERGHTGEGTGSGDDQGAVSGLSGTCSAFLDLWWRGAFHGGGPEGTSGKR